MSDDILERKNAFLGYKNNKFNKSKNWPMNLVQKWPLFEVFFMGNIGQENGFMIFYNEKTPF